MAPVPNGAPLPIVPTPFKNRHNTILMLKAEDSKVRNLLEQRIQLQVPIYQRSYDWGRKNYEQIFDDIEYAGSEKRLHFIGAITYSTEGAQAVDVPRYQIIDGQQRITSIMLLLRALKDDANRPDDVVGSRIEQLLYNHGEKKDGPDYHTLVLSEDDDGVFKEIMENGSTDDSGNLASCFNYFKNRLKKDQKRDVIWAGVQSLTAVLILLDRDDIAQSIFESMNSTGLDLTLTDLIQNYMLMSSDAEWQNKIFKKYWQPMERQFVEQTVKSDEFFWCYLSMVRKRAMPKKTVDTYREFKEYMKVHSREDEIKKISEYHKQYVKLTNAVENANKPLRGVIEYACDQGTTVANPLLLKVLSDHATGIITDDDTKQVFKLVGSYLLRSRVCGTLVGSNKRFPELIGKIDEHQYVESIRNALMSIRGNSKFPTDEAFKDALERMPLYTNKTACKYVLTSLNDNYKEMPDPEKLDIEHIMPQNLNDEWKNDLGENYGEVHEKYQHMIGNLTLTAYNSDLNNMAFSKKCDIYKESAIPMTRCLAEFDSWGENEIKERAKRLTNKAIHIWKYPKQVSNYDVQDKSEPEYDTMLEEDHLEGNNTVELWNGLKDKIHETCNGILFRMNKHYGSFWTPPPYNEASSRSICSLQSLRNSIHITYNTKIADGIINQSNFVKVATKGHLGPGEFRTTIASMDDIDKVVDIVKNVWDVKRSTYQSQ